MRRVKRIRSIDERNALVDDQALRQARMAAYIEERRKEEVLGFTLAYNEGWASLDNDFGFIAGRRGKYFYIDYTVTMQSARAVLSDYYNNLFQSPDGVTMQPIFGVFDWDPAIPTYGWRKPPNFIPGERFEEYDMKRTSL